MERKTGDHPDNSNPERLDRSTARKRLGLIVNPVAGLGGSVGLKGSDGADIQKQALALGAIPASLGRAIQALEQLANLTDVEIITYPGEMGANAAHTCGFQPTIIGAIPSGATTAAHTLEAARQMRQLGVDLLLFAGGDGTARDIYRAVGDTLPVLGIPAGVKIHSAVFATSPISAGRLAREYLQDSVFNLREAEVMDIDEDAVRQGRVSTELYGYLMVPVHHTLVQSLKAPSGVSDQAAMQEIAAAIVENMADDCLYIIGPGTTTRAITSELGLDKTLLGVDLVSNRELVATDVNESQILELIEDGATKLIVTPIGGQGYIFGRGNQQISHRVIKKLGWENVIVVSTAAKLHALGGRPLLVDTGDPELDQALSGYKSIVTGYREEMIFRVSC